MVLLSVNGLISPVHKEVRPEMPVHRRRVMESSQKNIFPDQEVLEKFRVNKSVRSVFGVPEPFHVGAYSSERLPCDTRKNIQ